jgi:recombinational DNA repair protein (RecF pathway)
MTRTPALDACPTCGAPTTPQRRGSRLHPSLCLTCTEDEIGMTLAEHRVRINEVLARGRTRKWQR